MVVPILFSTALQYTTVQVLYCRTRSNAAWSLILYLMTIFAFLVSNHGGSCMKRTMEPPSNSGRRKRLAQSAALTTVIQQRQTLVAVCPMRSLAIGQNGEVVWGRLTLSEANHRGSMAITWKARRIQSVSSDVALLCL